MGEKTYIKDSLDHVLVDSELIDFLVQERHITAQAGDFLLSHIDSSRSWKVWISGLLLMAGTCLILSGVVFFFAYNWQAITPTVKLYSIQLAILICVLAAFLSGVKRPVLREVMLVSASILVGVFLAVFGQVYQTGADSWELFLFWAALILPWVVISDCAPLWLLWMVISNIFLFQYIPFSENTSLYKSLFSGDLSLALLGFNGLLLVLEEIAAESSSSTFKPRWVQRVLLIAVLAPACIAGINLFNLNRESSDITVMLGAALSGFTHVALYLYYRYTKPDLRSVGAVFLSLCFIMLSAADECFTFVRGAHYLFLMGAFTLILFFVATRCLRFIALRMEKQDV